MSTYRKFPFNDERSRLGFNISEAFPYPGITGQNWSPSGEIPRSRDSTFFSNKERLTTKKLINFNFVANSSFSSINTYLCKKKIFEIMTIYEKKIYV